MNAMNAMTKQKTETEKPGDAAHYEELEELQLESVAAAGRERKKIYKFGQKPQNNYKLVKGTDKIMGETMGDKEGQRVAMVWPERKWFWFGPEEWIEYRVYMGEEWIMGEEGYWGWMARRNWE